MSEELSVSNHTSVLPSLLLVLNVVVPESVVVVVIVTWNNGLILDSIISFNFVNFCVR